MAKGSEKAKAEGKALQKFERARRKFEAAQEDYLLAREQGKQRIEKAQLEAERALTKVNERLEKRAEALSRAEARLLSTGSSKAKRAVTSTSDSNGSTVPASADEAADIVAELQEQSAEETPSPALIVPEGETV